MARGVGDDELATALEDRLSQRVARAVDRVRTGGGSGLEVAVGDIDRDSLFALGTQSVGQQRQVQIAVAAALGRLGDVLELILEDRLGVVQKPPDQRRLAVVDRARSRNPQQLAGLLHRHGDHL